MVRSTQARRSPRLDLGPARAIAVLGTASDVGKSLMTAGLCRLLRRRGVAVAPFKAQNMSLNSFVTADGGEMGRAQVLQAEACELLPEVDMNPILLKPVSNHRSQVILQGKVWGQEEASSYLNRTGEFVRYVRESYERLANRFEVVVIEGAGSAAEMNLRERDLANWSMVEWADAGVLLVADIDRGGIFAQVIGTIDLLTPKERARLLGVVINKFRGDLALFEDGVTFLEEHTGVPILGIVPFERTLRLDQEDSVEIERRRHTAFREDRINVAVILLPHLSNFTDFNPVAEEPDVILRYSATPADLLGADSVMIPGSKNTLGDLDYLRSTGFPEILARHVAGGGELIGICGGYQMLGLEVADPQGVEGGGQMSGLGFLEVTTELLSEKKTEQVEAIPLRWKEWKGAKVKGYAIHMGETRRLSHSPCFRILRNSGEEQDDGAWRKDGLVWGTYLHGLFDTPGFRRAWINQVRRRKRLPPLDLAVSEEVTLRLRSEIDRWADLLERHLELAPVLEAITPNFRYCDPATK